MNSPSVTAAMLYDLVRCPRRVALDLYGDPSRKDPVSPFVQLLWERGTAFEQEVMAGAGVPFTDLSVLSGSEKERATLAAIQRGDTLIYAGRIQAGDLLGVPDLLRKSGNGYTAGDIKSGAGLDGGSDLEGGRPKHHYAVQLALYTDILERLGHSDGHRRPFVWDVHGDEIAYDLNRPVSSRSPETWWEYYRAMLDRARAIVQKTEDTRPACMSECKLCRWITLCREELRRACDLTLIPELGRSRRDVMLPRIRSIQQMAGAHLDNYISGRKTVFRGIGPDTLAVFRTRARLLTETGARAFATETLDLPDTDLELFFDVETDPFRDVCYLHGFVERRFGDSRNEKYIYFLAENPSDEAEREAFFDAMQYLRSRAGAAVYYYSSYERTTYRKLQQRYPDVADTGEIEALFASPLFVDLYTDVVRKKTEWPVNDYSIKTLARHLGFRWRDVSPSGAESIQWYHQWVETGDPDIRQRILDYNEDDCAATRVLLDGLRGLAVRGI